MTIFGAMKNLHMIVVHLLSQQCLVMRADWLKSAFVSYCRVQSTSFHGPFWARSVATLQYQRIHFLSSEMINFKMQYCHFGYSSILQHLYTMLYYQSRPSAQAINFPNYLCTM